MINDRLSVFVKLEILEAVEKDSLQKKQLKNENRKNNWIK